MATTTPPCVPDIIHSGVSRVVVAMRDPNPQVAGRGIQQLKRAGITVDVGCLKHEAAKLNEIYVHWSAKTSACGPPACL